MKKIFIALVAVAAGYVIGNLSMLYDITSCTHKYGGVSFNEKGQKHILVKCGDKEKVFKL